MTLPNESASAKPLQQANQNEVVPLEKVDAVRFLSVARSVTESLSGAVRWVLSCEGPPAWVTTLFLSTKVRSSVSGQGLVDQQMELIVLELDALHSRALYRRLCEASPVPTQSNNSWRKFETAPGSRIGVLAPCSVACCTCASRNCWYQDLAVVVPSALLASNGLSVV